MARKLKRTSCDRLRNDAYNCGRRSTLALRGYQFKPGTNFSIKIDQKSYCALRNVTRWVVRTFVRNKWLAISIYNRRIFLEEICPEEIDAYLEAKALRKNLHKTNNSTTI